MRFFPIVPGLILAGKQGALYTWSPMSSRVPSRLDRRYIARIIVLGMCSWAGHVSAPLTRLDVLTGLSLCLLSPVSFTFSW